MTTWPPKRSIERPTKGDTRPATSRPTEKAAHGKGDRPAAFGGDQRQDQHRGVEDRAPGQNLGDAEHRHGAPRPDDEVADSHWQQVRDGHGFGCWIGGCTGFGAAAGFRLRLRFGFRLGGLCAFRTAAHVNHGAVAALHFRIHPAQNQDAAVERNHLAVVGAGGWLILRADIGLAAGRSLQRQFGGRRLDRPDASSRRRSRPG